MKVIYSPEQNAVFDRKVGSSSPSASKPEKVISDWEEHGIPMEIIPSSRLTLKGTSRVHDPEFVMDVMDGDMDNGFGNRSMEVAESLRYTNGSMRKAAELAFLHKESVCAPVSGFHHAGWSSAEGFCTFNGLMIAAEYIQRVLRRRTTILDCDYHYGNGTDGILTRRNLAFQTLKISMAFPILHATAGKHFGADPSRSGEFFDWLQNQLMSFEEARTKLVIYQAGADPHINDRSTRRVPHDGATCQERLDSVRLVQEDWYPNCLESCRWVSGVRRWRHLTCT
ncbi:MAG: hypothetical protein KAH54_09680 [Candidatus Sabulitectum sp.]|nr:hypothetical protein [Candidatus Sabulitectum sp.]